MSAEDAKAVVFYGVLIADDSESETEIDEYIENVLEQHGLELEYAGYAQLRAYMGIPIVQGDVFGERDLTKILHGIPDKESVDKRISECWTALGWEGTPEPKLMLLVTGY